MKDLTEYHRINRRRFWAGVAKMVGAVALVIGLAVAAFSRYPTPAPTSVPITSEELQIIKTYVHNLEDLNEINNELIEQYKLQILQLGGTL